MREAAKKAEKDSKEEAKALREAATKAEKDSLAEHAEKTRKEY